MHNSIHLESSGPLTGVSVPTSLINMSFLVITIIQLRITEYHTVLKLTHLSMLSLIVIQDYTKWNDPITHKLSLASAIAGGSTKRAAKQPSNGTRNNIASQGESDLKNLILRSLESRGIKVTR